MTPMELWKSVRHVLALVVGIALVALVHLAWIALVIVVIVIVLRFVGVPI